jgi:YggT family protein
MSLIEAVYVYFLHPLLSILVWVIIINAILSWLVAFRVVNPHNQLVSMIGRFTMAITEPLLRPFRRFIPPLGGIDITPIILILAIFFVRDWVLPQLLNLIVRSTSGG